jgi:hypothetical protein
MPRCDLLELAMDEGVEEGRRKSPPWLRAHARTHSPPVTRAPAYLRLAWKPPRLLDRAARTIDELPARVNTRRPTVDSPRLRLIRARPRQIAVGEVQRGGFHHRIGRGIAPLPGSGWNQALPVGFLRGKYSLNRGI